jgi:hypothetical protein
MSTMATLASPQKITFAEMRESGARGLLVYCADYRCCQSVQLSGISPLRPRLTISFAGRPA